MTVGRAVQTEDGWTLRAEVHPPSGVRRGVVVALPAMGVDARSLDRPAGAGLATTLARAGWEVWRADFRGHGASGPHPRDGGRWSYDDLVRHDVPTWVRAAYETSDTVVVAGHSLGGHVSSAACAEGLRVDALVLLATNIWLPTLEASSGRRLVKGAAMEAFRAAARVRGYFPSRRLRLGSADEAGGYVADLRRFYRDDRWGPRDGGDWLGGLADARVPAILSVAGAADRWLGHPDGVRAFTDHFTVPVDTWLASAGRLGLDADLDHMGVGCSPLAQPLWRRIGSWLDRATAG